MRNKIVKSIAIVLGISAILIAAISFLARPQVNLKTEQIAIKTASTQILADGQVTSQNEAKLQFQTGGKLVYLPFKEGDKVTVGQTIARLDTYALQRQLSLALNNYQTTRDTFDQQQQNSQTGVLQGQQKYSIEVTNKVGLAGDAETSAINDMAKRILDQNQASLNNSVSQVELANYAMQLASLTTPIDGVVTHEDVSVPNVNVTPLTSFIIDDPNTIILRAQVSENDIDFVSIGANAVIFLNGNTNRTFSGNVIKIHPQKTVNSSGENVYLVDIISYDLIHSAQFGQSASVKISGNTRGSTKLVPTWTILNNQYVWVDESGNKILKSVKTGKVHGAYTEVISGLNDLDTVVISPKAVVSTKYSIL